MGIELSKSFPLTHQAVTYVISPNPIPLFSGLCDFKFLERLDIYVDFHRNFDFWISR